MEAPVRSAQDKLFGLVHDNISNCRARGNCKDTQRRATSTIRVRLAYICAHPTTENPYINFQNLCTDSGPYINSASVGPASFHKPETLNHKSLNPAPFPPKPEVVARHALIGNFTACVNDLKNYAGLTGLGAPVEQDPPPEGTSARGRAARRAPRRPDGRGPLLGRVGDDVDARARQSSGRPSRGRSDPRTRHQRPRGGLRRARPECRPLSRRGLHAHASH